MTRIQVWGKVVGSHWGQVTLTDDRDRVLRCLALTFRPVVSRNVFTENMVLSSARGNLKNYENDANFCILTY